MANINNTTIIEAQEFPTNGNCKKVRNVTDDISYGSVKEAAAKLGVSMPCASVALNKGYLIRGKVVMFEADLHKSGDRLCAENAKANARAAKAEARADKAEAEKRAMEDEMAEFREWKAEQERQRKAEEERQKQETKLNDKLSKLEAERERRQARLDRCDNEIARVKMELALLNGKEVV